MFNDLWLDEEEAEHVKQGPWKCVLCGTSNRIDRTDCRYCMCPQENLCTKCKKINEAKARYCRFCGAITEHNHFGVFDPEVRKREAKDAKETIRRYKKYGHYYEWEDGPFQGPEEMYY